MGIFKSIAEKFQSDEDQEEKIPPSGKRKKESPYRKSNLVIPNNTSKEDLARVLEDLVSRGIVAKEEIERSLTDIGDETNFRARAALEAGKLLELEEQEKLLKTVKARFEKHNLDPNFKKLRKGIEWADVEAKLKANPEKMWSLNQMEETGGEPDVVSFDKKTGEYIFWDLSEESPKGRRNLGYDPEGQKDAEKKGYHPAGNAIEKAAEIGIHLLNEREYRQLQELGKFDNNSWSWIETPEKIRKTGVALFGRRYARAFFVSRDNAHYHDVFGGFRGSLRV